MYSFNHDYLIAHNYIFHILRCYKKFLNIYRGNYYIFIGKLARIQNSAFSHIK